jgi:hypothetical protein
MRFLLLTIFILLSVAGCSTTPSGMAYEPVIMQHKDKQFYEDLEFCRNKAVGQEVDAGRVGTSAGVGAALGAIFSGNVKGAVKGGAAGGVVGGVRESRRTESGQEQIIRRCMQKLGYDVLK